jgi:hypothetical protein
MTSNPVYLRIILMSSSHLCNNFMNASDGCYLFCAGANLQPPPPKANKVYKSAHHLLRRPVENCASVDKLPFVLCHCFGSRLRRENPVIAVSLQFRKKKVVELTRFHLLQHKDTVCPEWRAYTGERGFSLKPLRETGARTMKDTNSICSNNTGSGFLGAQTINRLADRREINRRLNKGYGGRWLQKLEGTSNARIQKQSFSQFTTRKKRHWIAGMGS